MDCIILDDDKISCKILEKFIAKTSNLRLKRTFYNPIEVLEHQNVIHANNLVFLDMELPQMHGLDFLKTNTHMPYVIFVSVSQKYALNAFDCNAIDFLLKPITYNRFLQSIEKVRQQVYVDTLLLEKSSQKAFFFKKKNVLYKILPTDIIWVESNDNYINVITKEHTFIVNNTLKSFEQILSKSNFLRAHRRYIINLEHLVCIEDNHLCVEINGKTASIPLSRNYKETLLNTAISLK